MYYFDYCATTPTNPEVLSYFNKVNNEFWVNPNSNYSLAKRGAELISSTSDIISKKLSLKDFDIIYTSGATEANNLALKGYCLSHQDKGKHIITSPYEHSSIIATLSNLQKDGFEITVADTDSEGKIDIDGLKKLIREDTILVTLTAVSSELGIINDIEQIGKMLVDYPNCCFHVDYTQMLGKKITDFSNVDMFSFSGHKIYGIKGIGALAIKKGIQIQPLINGGKSTTIFRAGTPSTELIASLGKAVSLCYDSLNEHSKDIATKSEYLKNKLVSLSDQVVINTPINGLPSVINVSILNKKAADIQKYLDDNEIMVSTQTACSLNSEYSQTVYKLTNDMNRAQSSIRISISHLTKYEEIDYLIAKIGELLCI